MSTYVPIQAITLSSNQLGTTGVTFTNIPQTYTDLVIVQNVSLTAAAIGLIRVGNTTIDTGSNYSQTRLGGNGSSATSSRLSNQTFWRTDLAHMTSGWGVYRTNVMNYSNSTTNKTCIQRYDNVPYGATETIVGLWRNTNPITTIQLYLDRAESYLAGSTFTLYGIGSGAPKAFGGDEVRTDGTYWYHIFTSSGRFEPVQALTCDYLVIAGGGGGGSDRGGGGGAGGYRTSAGTSGGNSSAESALSLLANTSYTVTIGAGGLGGAAGTFRGNKGGDTTFASIVAEGGGAGGSNQNGANGVGGNGGSGGGAGAYTSGTNAGGSATSLQGSNGGSSQSQTNGETIGGGGGGAGQSGTNGTPSVAGNGGNGLASTISGSSVTYAGGGGGGIDSRNAPTVSTGGTGGGGNGNDLSAGGNGTTNTGGGGGGGGLQVSPSVIQFAGGNGGSGIVIVRYLV